jgi:hypothetical protein
MVFRQHLDTHPKVHSPDFALTMNLTNTAVRTTGNSGSWWMSELDLPQAKLVMDSPLTSHLAVERKKKGGGRPRSG